MPERGNMMTFRMKDGKHMVRVRQRELCGLIDIEILRVDTVTETGSYYTTVEKKYYRVDGDAIRDFILEQTRTMERGHHDDSE